MKSNKFAILFSLLTFIITFVSCIEEVNNIDLPSSKAKLVVYSFITTSDTINVEVYQSVPYYDTPNDGFYNDVPIMNADVIISDENGNQATIPYFAKKRKYSLAPSEFIIEEGKTYNLSVGAIGFDAVTASTTVPNYTPIIDKVYVDTVPSKDGMNYSNDLLIGGVFVDQVDKKNYYRAKLNIVNDYYNYFTYSEGSIDNEFFTDKRCIDGRITFNQRVWFGPWNTITIYIINSDYGYYEYHRSLYKFESGNPFVEPIPVYSNINRGLGVFGSYLASKITITATK